MKLLRCIIVLVAFVVAASTSPGARADELIYSGRAYLPVPEFLQGSAEKITDWKVRTFGYAKITALDDGRFKVEFTIGKRPTFEAIGRNPIVRDGLIVELALENGAKTYRLVMNKQHAAVRGRDGKLEAERVLVDEDSFTPFLDRLSRYINTPTRQPAPTPTPKPAAESKRDVLAAPTNVEPCSSGALTPAVFLRYPFGFIPEDTKNVAAALQLLRDAGWQASASANDISVISTAKFTIPLTLYGRPIVKMTAYGIGQRTSTWRLEVRDSADAWTQAETEAFAARIVEDLRKQGFNPVAAPLPSNCFFGRRANNGRGLSFEVSARTSADGATRYVVVEVQRIRLSPRPDA